MELGSARKAIHDATALNQTQTDYIDDEAGINAQIAEGIVAGIVLSGVEHQPPVLRAWLLFAYAVDGTATHADLVTLVNALWTAFAAGKDLQPGLKTARIKALIPFLLDDTRVRCWRGVGRYTHVQMAKAIGVLDNHWSRDWAAIEKELIGIIMQWDLKALKAIRTMLRQIHGQPEAA